MEYTIGKNSILRHNIENNKNEPKIPNRVRMFEFKFNGLG
jgi:hypothetical protein